MLNQMKYMKLNLFNQTYKTKSTIPILEKPFLKEIGPAQPQLVLTFVWISRSVATCNWTFKSTQNFQVVGKPGNLDRISIQTLPNIESLNEFLSMYNASCVKTKMP